ncbi:general substrate transporter [Xylaria bambusicola]|uniref:general substrate transporter n=1 Tax=Xylaria bambusicola TaxID=326684 RepID=UPI002008E11E|nr:general substrate transporter [Xylaria bambusicola]KAI0517565.1 general substrate transporter [Xylaria bambusicola]
MFGFQKFEPWRRVPGKVLLLLVNIVAATALIFEGFNQGVFGTVSSTPGFIEMAKIGHDGVVTDTTKQGGLAAAYYFGAIWGCFIGGWVGDKIGRKRGVLVGTLFGIVGAALMAGSQNSNTFIVARVIAGLGIGFINAIIPPWVSELSQAHDRGSSFSLVFVANYLGIVIAYWINFGIRGYKSEFRWRFPLAWMIIPLLIVDATVPFLPESPRWLIANKKRQEAIDILCKVRGDLSATDPKIVAEVEQLDAIVEASHHKRNNLLNIVLGGRYSGSLHLGRRAVMGFALQLIQQWTGILAIAGWATTLFALAGFDSYKSAWLGGLVNTFGVPGTAAAALVVDRIGRIKSLIVSFITQGIALFIVAALIKTSQDASSVDADQAVRLGTGAAAFVFVYIWFFTMFNIIPSWIYGTEIWPQEIRAKGYSFTIFGWAVGSGVTQFVIPILLQRLGWATFVFFGALNIVAIPIIYLFYPEVAKRSLEEINLLFTSDSLFVKANMREYDRRINAAEGSIPVAARNLLSEVDNYGSSSLDVGDLEKEGI